MSRLGPDHAVGLVGQRVARCVGGFGFGLALAPVNAAVLAATDDDVHGLARAGVVVSRMVGMLVGISALTTIGLRRYYAEAGDIPPPQQVCGGDQPVRRVRPPAPAGRASRRSTRSSPARRSARWSRPALALVAVPRPPRDRGRYPPRPLGRPVSDPVARLRRPARRQRGVRRDLRRRRLRRRRPCRRRDRDLHGLPHRAAATCSASGTATPRSSATPAAGSPRQALEALVLGVHLLGVERILVVPHTRCAMATSTEEELHERVSASAGMDARWQPFHVVDGPARGPAPRTSTACAPTR